MEEVTPENIKELYIDKETPIMENLVSYSIDIINKLLKERYQAIVDDGFVYVKARGDLDNDGFCAKAIESRWTVLADNVRKFYKNWKVSSYFYSGGHYFCFRPKTPIDIEIRVDFNKKQKKEVTLNDIINNRAEILDLGEK